MKWITVICALLFSLLLGCSSEKKPCPEPFVSEFATLIQELAAFKERIKTPPRDHFEKFERLTEAKRLEEVAIDLNSENRELFCDVYKPGEPKWASTELWGIIIFLENYKRNNP